MKKKRHVLTGIAFRLLVFNIVLVFLPAAFFFFLSTYEQQLLKYLENGLVQQGRIIAAAVGGGDAIDGMQARAVIGRLRLEHEARYRILDTDARIVVDSSGFSPPETAESPELASEKRKAFAAQKTTSGSPVRGYEDPGLPLAAERDVSAGTREESDTPATAPLAQESPLYRIAIFPIRLYRKYLSPPQASMESADFYVGKEMLNGREVSLALSGTYGAATRISSAGQISVTLYSALPVWDDEHGRVIGAVLVSQSTYRLLRDLYDIRLDIFKIFLGSVAAAVLISIFLSLTIARPLRRLGDEALGHFDSDNRFRGEFSYQRKKDEIGSLARALHTLSSRLKNHIKDMESFAGDVSHELKNPLASIRSAAELALDTRGEKDNERFLHMILSESVRMEALLSKIREVSVLDGRLDQEEKKTVEITALSESVLESFRIQDQEKHLTYTLKKPAQPVYVSVSPERIVQVLNNLLDNAAGFSPENGTVTISVARRGNVVYLSIADEGPGISDSIKEDVLKRFFTFRPPSFRKDSIHSGLGLSIVKAIVERYGGSVRIGDNNPRGAKIVLNLPAATDRFLVADARPSAFFSP